MILLTVTRIKNNFNKKGVLKKANGLCKLIF